MAKRPKKKSTKKSSKKRKRLAKKRKKTIKKRKKILKKISNTNQETIFKTKSDWVKKALVNKKQYEKNIITLLNKMMSFGKKRVKELLG